MIHTIIASRKATQTGNYRAEGISWRDTAASRIAGPERRWPLIGVPFLLERTKKRGAYPPRDRENNIREHR